MTYKELAQAVAKLLPGATLGEDDDGQLVIYTDRQEVAGWVVRRI